MRYFLRRRVPPFSRMLIVESGSRSILEAGIPRLRNVFAGHSFEIDLLTCLPGQPPGSEASLVFRVTDCKSSAGRRKLLSKLFSLRYRVIGIICSNEPLMTPWKLAVTLLFPAKILIINENADFFWLDRGSLAAIRRFIAVRAGLDEEGGFRQAFYVLAFPFVVVYLLLFAGLAHAKRGWRLLWQQTQD